MSIYLKIPGRKDCYEIFKLEISQSEGELAIASVMLNKDFHVDGTMEATIMRSNSILLKGEIYETPTYSDHQFTIVRIISHFQKKQLKKITSDFQASTHYNEELSSDFQNDITEELPVRFFFSRTSGDVKLSRIVDDTHIRDINVEDYWSSSIKKTNEPLSKVNMYVTAKWIQERNGRIDLFPIIASLFPENMVNSLNNLKNQWWRLARSLPKSCYSIGTFRIKNVFPNTVPHSCSFSVNDTTVKIKRFWFDGVFDLSWNYKQKIEETLHFSLHNPTAKNGIEKNINIKLNNLNINKELGSFFSNKRGAEVIKSVARRAFNHMLARQRNIKLEICGNFESLYDITVDDSVRVQLKDSYVIGKVVHSMIKITGEQRFVKLKILVCQNNIECPDIKYDPKKEDDIFTNIIEDISVENPPSFQIDSSKHIHFKSIADLKSHISSIPTKIRLKLKNLNTVKCLKKTVFIEAAAKQTT